MVEGVGRRTAASRQRTSVGMGCCLSPYQPTPCAYASPRLALLYATRQTWLSHLSSQNYDDGKNCRIVSVRARYTVRSHRGSKYAPNHTMR